MNTRHPFANGSLTSILLATLLLTQGPGAWGYVCNICRGWDYPCPYDCPEDCPPDDDADDDGGGSCSECAFANVRHSGVHHGPYRHRGVPDQYGHIVSRIVYLRNGAQPRPESGRESGNTAWRPGHNAGASSQGSRPPGPADAKKRQRGHI